MQVRRALSARLLERRAELEETALVKIHAVFKSAQNLDPEYVAGMRAAVSDGLDYGLTAVEHRQRRPLPIPATLLSQARLAAFSGVSLATVLQQHLAIYTLLGDFILQEASCVKPLKISEVHNFMREQAILFDGLIPAVTEEYSVATAARPESTSARRAEHIRHLLAGGFPDPSELSYELETWHLGVVAVGPIGQVLSHLAKELDRRILVVQGNEGRIWAWFGGRDKLDPREFEYTALPHWPRGASLAIGEPARGLAGWRLTHRQALAILPILLKGSNSILCYADHALLASMARDDLLVHSLHQIFLAPLANERDGGRRLRQTLRAYFAARGHVSSAAAALKVSRKTVSNHLATVEKHLGRPLPSCASELEAALRLEGTLTSADRPLVLTLGN